MPVRPSSITDYRPSLTIQGSGHHRPALLPRIRILQNTLYDPLSLLILFPAQILPRNVHHVAYLPGAVADKFCTEKEIKKGTSAGRLDSNGKDGERKGPCSNDRRQEPTTAERKQELHGENVEMNKNANLHTSRDINPCLAICLHTFRRARSSSLSMVTFPLLFCVIFRNFRCFNFQNFASQ